MTLRFLVFVIAILVAASFLARLAIVIFVVAQYFPRTEQGRFNAGVSVHTAPIASTSHHIGKHVGEGIHDGEILASFYNTIVDTSREDALSRELAIAVADERRLRDSLCKLQEEYEKAIDYRNIYIQRMCEALSHEESRVAAQILSADREANLQSGRHERTARLLQSHVTSLEEHEIVESQAEQARYSSNALQSRLSATKVTRAALIDDEVDLIQPAPIALTRPLEVELKIISERTEIAPLQRRVLAIKAELSAAGQHRDKLEKATLTADAHGFIWSKSRQRGYVEQGQRILTTVSLDDIFVQCRVPLEQLAEIHTTGLATVLTSDGRRFAARVSHLFYSHEVDQRFPLAVNGAFGNIRGDDATVELAITNRDSLAFTDIGRACTVVFNVVNPSPLAEWFLRQSWIYR